MVATVLACELGLLRRRQDPAGDLEELLLLLAQMVVHLLREFARLLQPGGVAGIEGLQVFHQFIDLMVLVQGMSR